MIWINKARAARLVAGVAVAAFVGFGMTAGTGGPTRAGTIPEHDYHGYHHGWGSGGY